MKNKKGFTLIELLVVIAIIGILAIISVPTLFKNIEKAKVDDLLADINAIKSSTLSYYADNTSSPNDLSGFDSGELLPNLDGSTTQCFNEIGVESISNPFSADSYKVMGNIDSGVKLEIMFPNTISKNVLKQLNKASLKYKLLSLWDENDTLVIDLLGDDDK